MAKTKRVRVYPEEYEMIKDLAEKKDVTFAEAVRKLIHDESYIVNGEVVDPGSVDSFEKDTEDDFFNEKLLLGAMAASAYFLNKYMTDNS